MLFRGFTIPTKNCFNIIRFIKAYKICRLLLGSKRIRCEPNDFEDFIRTTTTAIEPPNSTEINSTSVENTIV